MIEWIAGFIVGGILINWTGIGKLIRNAASGGKVSFRSHRLNGQY